MSSAGTRIGALIRNDEARQTANVSRLVLAYGVAGVAVLGTLALKMAIPLLGELHPFVLLPIGIAIAAWYGGFGPGVAATVGSMIGTDILFIPPAEVGIDIDVAGLSALLVEGVLISALTVGLRRARHRAHAVALVADAARREAALALQMREELINLWTAKLRGPVSDFATIVDEARLAHRDRDHARTGIALERLRLDAGLMRRTVEHWNETGHPNSEEPLIRPG